MRTLALTLPALACLLSSQAFSQNVHVVDDDGGPGIDFTDLQAAVDAAGHGDRIEVRHGLYNPATVSKPLTLMGEAFTQHHLGPSAEMPWLSIQDLSPGEVVVLADFEIDQLFIGPTAGSVIVDRVAIQFGWADRVDDLRCNDIFLWNQESDINGTGFLVDASFAQFTNSRLHSKQWPGGTGRYGEVPLGVRQGSTALIVNCDLRGGHGADEPNCALTPAYGGSGLTVRESEVRILRSTVTQGFGGTGCSGQGFNGVAVSCINATVVASDCQFHGMAHLTADIPGRPAMTLRGGTRPGEVADFNFFVQGGVSSRLFVGRRPTMTDLPSIDLPLLHSAERGLSLGAAPPSGQRTLPFFIRPLQRGTLVFAQASGTTGAGTNLSNSVTLVVR